MGADSLRQTGRTTRMLEEATRLAEDGREVYVVADSQHEANRCRILLGRGSRVRALAWSDERVTWGSIGGAIRGASRDAVVLFDHHAIEDRFAPVLEMLHRFDEGA